MLSFTDTLTIVITVAICTFGIRLFPFVIFGGKKEVPKSIKLLGDCLPACVISILIIYCIKDVKFGVFPSGLPEIISIGAVGIIHFWKRNNLMSIGVGTVLYMFLIQKIF